MFLCYNPSYQNLFNIILGTFVSNRSEKWSFIWHQTYKRVVQRCVKHSDGNLVHERLDSVTEKDFSPYFINDKFSAKKCGS